MAQDAKYYRLAGRIFADFSATIAIPAVLAALLGKWLDNRYSTESRYVVILLVLAFTFTVYAIVKKTKIYKKAYESVMNEEK